MTTYIEPFVARLCGRIAALSGRDEAYMADLPLRDDLFTPGVRSAVAHVEATVLQARGVHRAIADLRRGVPVFLTGAAPLVVLPAETASARGLAEFAAVAGPAAVLLLAPSRAAAVLRRPVAQGGEQDSAAVAVRANADLLASANLRAVADPTAEQLLPESFDLVAAPPLSAAALAVAKLARLLPAMLAAPARADAQTVAASLALSSVPAADVLLYPARAAVELVRVAEAMVPLENASDARVVAFRAPDSAIEHLAILIGRPETAKGDPAPLVRVHSECFTGDLLGSLRCDCGPQLRTAIARIAHAGTGAVLYLAQEGRGIGLVNKLRAYALQDRGLDTIDANRALGWGADERNFLVAATMLDQLGIGAVRLLTNNPDKVAALTACGVHVVEREPLVIAPNGVNDVYLAAKAARLGHYLG